METFLKTAEAYRGELMKALEIHDIASLTRYAIRTGLVVIGIVTLKERTPNPTMRLFIECAQNVAKLLANKHR